MGEQQAAITIAAIYQRQDQINSAGGYLRSLTDRAKAAKFSVWPMVMALLRAKLDASKTTETGSGTEAAAVDLEMAGKVVRTESRLEISDALRRSLDRPGRGS
jgi:replication initiation protein RepC